MKEPSPHRIHAMPGHLVRRLHQIAVALYTERTKAISLTPIQYAVLAVLDTNEGVSQRELADMVALDRSTIGEVIQRLADRGFLTRVVSTADRRAKKVQLTVAGKEALVEMDTLVPASQDELLTPLSEGERMIFLLLLTKLVHVNNHISPAPLRLLDEQTAPASDQVSVGK